MTGRFPRSEIISLLDVNRRHNLAESTSRSLKLGELMQLAGGIDALGDLELGYGTSQGLPALREAVAAATDVGAGDVMTTQGAALALFLLAFEVCRPGDRALLVRPCFPPSRDTLTANGVAVDEVALRFDDRYRLDPERVARAMTPETRLVSIATPQNPSGVRSSTDDVHAILEAMAAKAPRALLVVDETYRAANFGAKAPASTASLDPRIVVTSSMSKAHGAPGLRVGWVVTKNRELLERLLVAKLNTVVSGSVLDETLAARLLARTDDLATRQLRVGRALEAVAQWRSRESGRVEWVRPDGGAMCCVRLSREVYDEAALTRFWKGLAARDLQLAPGSWFGDPDGSRVFRLGFGLLPEANLEPALEALSRAMDDSLAA